jgi:hypothetical protein
MLWHEKVVDSVELMPEQRTSIRAAYRNGLVQSCWVRWMDDPVTVERRDKISKREHADRIGCAKNLLSEKGFPNCQTQIWTLIAYFLSLDLPFPPTQLKYKPLGLRLDGYENAIKSLSVLEQFKNEKWENVTKMQILSLLCAFVEIDMTEPTLSAISDAVKNNLATIIQNTNIWLDEIKLPGNKMNKDSYQEATKYTKPMLIVLSVLKHEAVLTYE